MMGFQRREQQRWVSNPLRSDWESINRETYWYGCSSALLGFRHALYYISRIVLSTSHYFYSCFQRGFCVIILIRMSATKIYVYLCLCMVREAAFSFFL
jgi:hypothetical protein